MCKHPSRAAALDSLANGNSVVSERTVKRTNKWNRAVGQLALFDGNDYEIRGLIRYVRYRGLHNGPALHIEVDDRCICLLIDPRET